MTRGASGLHKSSSSLDVFSSGIRNKPAQPSPEALRPIETLEPAQSDLRPLSKARLSSLSGRTSFPPTEGLTPSEKQWRLVLAFSIATLFVSVMVTGLLQASVSADLAVQVLGGFGALFILYAVAAVYHSLRYQPFVLSYKDSLPKVTVIVPAYNEGASVRLALESALESDYPAELLEVIAVDDGSTDDTWDHITAVAANYPGWIRAIRMPTNGGKRAALVAGFEAATGDVAVTVDSDSKLHPSAIREIVAPIVLDSEVAAVAGRVSVLNRSENLMTKLLAARFWVTFDLARAAQSRSGAVLCTPGALSAYRLSAVREVVSAWSTQTFWGAPCTIAEDRALTTWLLRKGHRSVYQRTAEVETLMPTGIRKALRMLIRWERGNIREDIVLLPRLFTKWRKRDQLWPTIEVAVELLQYPVGWFALYLAATNVLRAPAAFGSLALVVLLGSLAQNLYCLRSRRSADFGFGVVYSLIALIGLQWIFPYSLLTVRDGRWMTR